MVKYQCRRQHIYEPARGDPTQGIPQETAFEDLPYSWVCPLCGATKSFFLKHGGKPTNDYAARHHHQKEREESRSRQPSRNAAKVFRPVKS